MKVSILVPVYNEQDNLAALLDELLTVLDREPWSAEIIFVDDGSTDGSTALLQSFEQKDPRCKLLKFSRNFGQTAAMQAGIEHATGDVIVPIDADLQNDPADIPKLVAKLEQGFDVVSGWRKRRKDRFLSRRLPSMLANGLISWWTGVSLHDYGCTLKAYRAHMLKETRLYGEMHRFIPVYAAWRGARVTEIEVNHRPRRFGRSNYGLARTFKVLLDLLTVKLLGSYSTKPNYLFGGLGGIFVFMAMLTFLGVTIEKLAVDRWPHKMTMLLFASLLATVGVLLIMMGLLAELIVRTYHESQKKPTYILDSDLHPSGGARNIAEHNPQVERRTLSGDLRLTATTGTAPHDRAATTGNAPHDRAATTGNAPLEGAAKTETAHREGAAETSGSPRDGAATPAIDPNEMGGSSGYEPDREES